MSLDGTMMLRLKMGKRGKVHGWNGKTLACGPPSKGRGEPMAPSTAIDCVRCCDALNRRALGSLRSFTAAARKYGYLPS